MPDLRIPHLVSPITRSIITFMINISLCRFRLRKFWMFKRTWTYKVRQTKLVKKIRIKIKNNLVYQENDDYSKIATRPNSVGWTNIWRQTKTLGNVLVSTFKFRNSLRIKSIPLAKQQTIEVIKITRIKQLFTLVMFVGYLSLKSFVSKSGI